jgi:hypothetical protein
MPFLLPLLSILVLVSSPSFAAEQAGVSAAIQGRVELARAQAPGRAVVSGEEIFLQDAIQSGPRSGMQILLLDETVFTIGPDSEITIDEFVYDPSTGAGKVSAAVSKGVFRFVTGRVAKQRPENMELKLPAGMLGVRGTMAAGKVDPATKASVLVLLGEGLENDTGAPAGAIEVCNAGSCQTARRPGFAIAIGGENEPPTLPFRMPLPQLNAITGAVSDPESSVDVAAGGGGTDVAAGPGGEGDPRSASDVAGEGTASGLDSAERTRERLTKTDTVDGLTDNALQDERAPGSGNLPDLIGFDPSLEPEIEFPTFAGITTLGQLDALAASGDRSGYYERNDIALVDTSGVTVGLYDFLLSVDFQERQGFLSFTNIDAPSYGLAGAELEESGIDLSGLPPEIPAAFGAFGIVTGAIDSPCEQGCQAFGSAVLLNQAGIADAAAQVLEIEVDPNLGQYLITEPTELIVPRTD